MSRTLSLTSRHAPLAAAAEQRAVLERLALARASVAGAPLLILDEPTSHLDTAAGGVHPGFRPVHARGLMLAGTFTPGPDVAALTRAPHANQPVTPVTARFSLAPGVPTAADNDASASPQGLGLRFHLGEHEHTDIVAHSVNAFPARTGEEFLEFLQAGASQIQERLIIALESFRRERLEGLGQFALRVIDERQLLAGLLALFVQ